MKQLIITIFALLLPMVTFADKEGKCGDNVTYYFESATGILTIQGSGPMWNAQRDEKGKLIRTFEYDKYEKSNEEEKDFIDWNTNYDDKVNSDEDKFAYVKIYGLRYIIKFDNFDLKEENEDQIHDTLVDIFKTCENTKEHDWPLQITLDEKNIKYK